MEFKEKEYDGPYEVCGLDMYCEDELFNGVLYYPPVKYQKPYPLIVFFHGFPHLFTLQEIIRDHEFLLDKGYAFIAFNFRGYRYSEGTITIQNQVQDALKILEFVEKMSDNQIFNRNNINLIAHDFGAYIALILSSKINNLNQILLAIVACKYNTYDNFHNNSPLSQENWHNLCTFVISYGLFEDRPYIIKV